MQITVNFATTGKLGRLRKWLQRLRPVAKVQKDMVGSFNYRYMFSLKFLKINVIEWKWERWQEKRPA